MKKTGFTLLELLIVISIIGILVTVAVASYTSAQKKARDSRRMTDIKSIQTAAEQFYSDQGAKYPSSDADATFLTYLPAGFPVDPKNTATFVYTYTPQPQVPAPCDNGVSGDCTAYCACAALEGSGNGNATDSSCTFGTGSYFCVRNLQ